MKRPFAYDPENPKREAVLSFMCDFIRSQGRKLSIVVAAPVKSREQEERYHAMIGDIADQVQFHGKQRDAAHFWKRLLIDAFKYDTKDMPELRDEWVKFGNVETVPALNHDGFVVLGEQSRNFNKKLASAFIEWLFAFGAEHNVHWTESKNQAA